LPAAIGSWFARDLTRVALALVEGERVVVRAVEELRIEAVVSDARGDHRAVIEWAGGTGPVALRPVCSCGANGVCEHVVAALETVRSQTELEETTDSEEIDLNWLPVPRGESRERRARCVWPVFSSPDGLSLGAQLVLDSPRLRAAARDAQSIAAMMDTTPADDWDEFDRELMRDDAVQEAFAGRNVPRALARALFQLARHPRLRFDDDPAAGRHPSELADFQIDLRGLNLRAKRCANGFAPAFEATDGRLIAATEALLLEGPPTWIATRRGAFLIDGSFDARKAIAAARSANGVVGGGRPLTARSIARVAPYLTEADRAALGIVDAGRPSAELAFAWDRGVLLATVTFIDRASRARAPYAALGAIAPQSSGFTRFGAEYAALLGARLLEAGFVPRAADGFALHGADRAAAFIRDVLPVWDDLERRLDPGLLDVAAGNAALDIDVSAHRSGEDRNWFELRVDVFVGGGEALSQKELAALLSSSERFADVRGKLVDLAKLRSRSSLLSDLAQRRRSGFAALLALHDELHENFERVRLPPEIEELREKLREFEGIAHVEPPPLHNGALRQYQEQGLDFLAYLAEFGFGGVLADDMGTGKTLIAISYLLHRKIREGPAPALVIAPTSVTHTWQTEIARFAPELTTLRLHSGNERAARYDEVPLHDVVITSYALARLDADQLSRFHFRALILDEAQMAKNPASQIARVVRSLRADHRLALTGTPVENSLRDLWSIFAFVEPGLLGTESSFKRRFEIPIAENGQEGERAAATLRMRLEPFVLRRTKEDVAPELPERTEVVLECDLSPLQKRLYRGVAEAARRDVFEVVERIGIENATVHVLAALTRLRQICSHPGLIFEEYLNEPEASAKLDAFLETVDEILSGGHRVLVFSAFASMLHIIRDELDRRNVGYGYLDGSTKDRDRRLEVERFMQPDGPPLFLCSLKAGGVGLTLTAADYVILYDPWWNPAVERQAIDRTHRIGQHRAVTAYRLLTSGTVEEKIRALAEQKTSLSRSIIKADGALAKSLTRGDLESLFADPQ
jgi:superfamily II DNA or RNA helicase